MTPDEVAQALLGRSWEELSEHAAEIVAAVAAGVRAWEWVESGEHVELEGPHPLYGHEKTSRLRADPTDTRRRLRSTQYGRDGSGRIVVARRFTGSDASGGWPAQEGLLSLQSVWVRALDGSDVQLRFHHRSCGGEQNAELAWLLKPVIDGGVLKEVRSWGSGGDGSDVARRESYEYREGRITGVVTERFSERLGSPGEAYRRSREDVTRGDDGSVSRITWRIESDERFPGSVGDEGVSYVKRSAPAVREAKRLVERELPERILRWAVRVAPPEPVFSLGLLYSLDDPTLPPALGMGTVAELERWKRTHGSAKDRGRLQRDEALSATMWNPAEYGRFEPNPAELSDTPELLDAYAQLAQDWQVTENDREPRAMLVRCAKGLAQRDWGGILPIGPAFAVFATDDELSDLGRNLKATVPAVARRSLSRLEP